MVVLLSGCKRKQASEDLTLPKHDLPATNRLVEAVEVGAYSFEVSKTYVGHLEPNQRVKLHAELDGVVERLNIREGNKVVSKQELFRISAEELSTRRNLAKTNYQLDNAEYERSKKLHVDKLISPAELERSFNAREIARLNLKLADLEYEKSVVRAPFDGFLFKLSVESGEFVNRGILLTEILDVSKFKALISVPENDIRFFIPELKVQLLFDALPGWKQEGQIFSVGKEASLSTRDFEVQVVTDSVNEQLRSGMLVRAKANLVAFVGQVLAPRHALIEKNEGTFVFVVQSGVVSLKKVETGISRGNLVQIKQGLSTGELLVVSGQHKLADGNLVRVRKVDMQSMLDTEIFSSSNPENKSTEYDEVLR